MVINTTSKFLIIVAISTSLIVTIYGSSVSVVFAATTNCGQSKVNTKQQICSVTDESGVTFWRCTKHKDGTYSCVQETKAGGSNNVTSALEQGIISAQKQNIGDNNTNFGINNTKSLTGGGEGGGLLKGGANTDFKPDVTK